MCEVSPDGEHHFELTELVVNGTGRGMASVDTCRHCGTTAYEASGTDG